MEKQFETVMGLEVHVELKTNTKIFCNCTTEFGGEPNTHVCPVCMGLPGALPVLNKEVVKYAIKAGLATNCEITKVGRQDRKNYFYPDLGKAYQISQGDTPLCHNGYLEIETEDQTKRIGITRIHIEEDAGKLVHREGVGTLVDLNRSGMPLIEIVSEPDLRTAEEVKAYLQKLRANMLYIDVSDCKMNEGSFRVDVNLSVREMGEEKLGVRVEIKNLNSYQSIMRAIAYEEQRQIKAIKEGEKLIQETRGFNQDTGKTYSMREKENAEDYRLFPDPDLMPIVISDDMIKSLRNTLPELPDIRKTRYINEFGLSNYDGEQLTSSIEVATYFEEAVINVRNPKIVANLIISEIFKLASPDEFDVPFSPKYLSDLVTYLEDEKINNNSAKKVIEEMWNTNKSPKEIIDEQDLEQINDEKALEVIINEVLKTSEKAVNEYKSGKEKALQSIVGKVMGKTRGRANPQLTLQLLKEKI
ncbi:MAG: Asp-tRNA(Asn)/Glu-tRNA(Gln) amidotransferase subunit GatB [Tissierellia bacterium]|nr:Asp-tRNA(Asn)/Glu-tRNA(Gln) amidotransferase subunit GatB [Tissierellia bacterium]MDD4726355.1 Asp-tRNA(Asn)/Glu-tRNA(Gln) amidotransferase subunit GatB [Tissierellia bacterium]